MTPSITSGSGPFLLFSLPQCDQVCYVFLGGYGIYSKELARRTIMLMGPRNKTGNLNETSPSTIGALDALLFLLFILGSYLALLRNLSLSSVPVYSYHAGRAIII